jgi:ribosomal protein S18 acetylase RimI-like enzyme
MPIEIRLAIQADIPLLVELNRTVQALHADCRPDLFKEPDSVAVADWFTGKLASDSTRAWIAMADGRAVGYLLAISQRRAEGAFTHARQFVEIDQIAVLPSHRRQGAARRLVDIASEDAKARSLGDLELSSWQFNADAHAAFRALGFQEQAMRFRRSGS